MALISCPECERQVSDRAQTCPGCGVEISNVKESKAAGGRLTNIQQTSKKLKIQQLISTGLLLVGVIWLFSAMGSDAEEPSPMASLFILVGFVWLVITRVRIWWHHR